MQMNTRVAQFAEILSQSPGSNLFLSIQWKNVVALGHYATFSPSVASTLALMRWAVGLT